MLCERFGYLDINQFTDTPYNFWSFFLSWLFCLQGIDILSELCKKNVNDRRDYMYFLAIGYAHLKNYTKAKEMLDPILILEPTNQQVLELRVSNW